MSLLGYHVARRSSSGVHLVGELHYRPDELAAVAARLPLQRSIDVALGRPIGDYLVVELHTLRTDATAPEELVQVESLADLTDPLDEAVSMLEQTLDDLAVLPYDRGDIRQRVLRERVRAAADAAAAARTVLGVLAHGGDRG